MSEPVRLGDIVNQLPHPWLEGTECMRLTCTGFEHSHITNPGWIPAFERIHVMAGVIPYDRG